MKKLFLRTALIIGLVSMSATAFAGQPGMLYVGGNVGMNFMSDSDLDGLTTSRTLEWDTGWLMSGVVGYTFNDVGAVSPRIEGEVGYVTADFDKTTGVTGDLDTPGDMSSTSFLINVYTDFAASERFKPFLTAGAGFALNDGTRDGWNSNDDTVFAWQVGAGVAFAMAPNMDLDLKYRYYSTDSLKLAGVDVDFDSNQWTVGFRYSF